MIIIYYIKQKSHIKKKQKKLTPDIDISSLHDQMVIHHIWNSHVNSTCVPPCLGGPGVRKGQSAGDVCVSGASDTSDANV